MNMKTPDPLWGDKERLDFIDSMDYFYISQLAGTLVFGNKDGQWGCNIPNVEMTTIRYRADIAKLATLSGREYDAFQRVIAEASMERSMRGNEIV